MGFCNAAGNAGRTNPVSACTSSSASAGVDPVIFIVVKDRA